MVHKFYNLNVELESYDLNKQTLIPEYKQSYLLFVIQFMTFDAQTARTIVITMNGL